MGLKQECAVNTQTLNLGGGGNLEVVNIYRKKNLLIFDKDDLVQVRISVLLLFSFRKMWTNQDLISCRQSDREVGGRVEVGLGDM